MNTHILIPIKDIKDKINDIYTSKDEDEYDIGAISALEELLKNKQISLDDASIEEKAEKLYPLTGESIGNLNREKRIAYKQALKDIRDGK